MANKPIKVTYIKWVTHFHLPTRKGKLQTFGQHICFESLFDTLRSNDHSDFQCG